MVFTGKEKFNPGLDMIATTKILTTVPSDFEDRLTRERIDLSIHITGTLDTVEINPAEGSSYTKEELLTLIVANYAQSDTTLVLTQVSERISNLISKELEDLGGTQLRKLGVETFEIEPFYGDETDLLKAKFTVGFYTAQGLYVYGKSPLSGEATREVGFEYRFNRNFLMEGRRDEEELYHLNFKLHWDY